MRTKKEIAKLLQDRAFFFMCSYPTAWKQWLEEDEKQGYTYKEIIQYVD